MNETIPAELTTLWQATNQVPQIVSQHQSDKVPHCQRTVSSNILPRFRYIVHVVFRVLHARKGLKP